MIYGFDISAYQKALTDAGTLPGDFVICRAWTQLNKKDECYDRFMEEGKKAGKLLGSYLFLHAGTDTYQQCENFINTVKPWLGETILALDVEEPGILAAQVEVACEYIYLKTGVNPLVYINSSMLNNGYVSADTRAKNGIWLAGYPSAAETSEWQGLYPYKVPDNTLVAIWQFTSNFRVDGYSGPLDADVAYMTRDAWLKYAAVQPTKARQAAEAKASGKTVQEIAQEVVAGKWGNGADRKRRLRAAGYDPDEVQTVVNSLLRPASTRKSISQIAQEVIAGKWGNGASRKQKLEQAGYDYQQVQAEVNRRLGQ